MSPEVGNISFYDSTGQLYRSTTKAQGYKSSATTLSKPDDASKAWKAAPQIYWPDHSTHYHFRGVVPTKTDLKNDGTNDYIEVFSHSNGDLLVGMPDAPAGTKCGSTEHTEVDVNENGICAREAHMWDEIRRLMWDYVGIVRTNKRLARAAHRIKTLRREIRDYYFRYLVTPDTLELRNLAVCAELIVKSAQKRRESRGLHFTLDYPRQSKRPRQTVIEGYRG